MLKPTHAYASKLTIL